MENKKPYKRAAMWVKKTRANSDYYSVKVEFDDGSAYWINLFYNKFKTNDKHPSFVTIGDSENKNDSKLDDGIPF